MSFKLNNIPIVGGRVTFPRSGAWHATFDVGEDAATQLSLNTKMPFQIFDRNGKVVLSYTCSPVLNVTSTFGNRRINVVGGGGSMSNISTARNLSNGPTYKRVMLELMKDATLDTLNTTISVSGFTSTYQSIAGVSVGKQLSRFLNSLGAVWRVGSDGTIAVVTDTYPAIVLPTDRQQINCETSGAKIFAVQSFDVIPLPGTTLDGTRIEEVEIEFDGVTSVLSVRPIDATRALATLLGGFRQDEMFSRSWPGTVTKQTGQTLDINPDDASIKGVGLANVPITFGIPGTTVQVSPGTRVRFCYDVSDPARPRVCAFEPSVGGTNLLVTIGNEATAQFVVLYESLKTYLDSHQHGTGVGPSSPPLTPLPETVASIRLKVE